MERLWYSKPASVWEEALPIGNGRLGGMVYGGVDSERIELNEDTLWSGFPRDPINYEAQRHLAKARELVFAGKVVEAQRLIGDRMLGRDVEAYLPLGAISVSHVSEGVGATEYRRELDIERGIAAVRYERAGMSVTSEMFSSVPDQAIVIRYEASGGTLDLNVTLDSKLTYTVQGIGGRELLLRGRAPTHIADNYRGDHPMPVLYEEGRGLPFEARLFVRTDGTCETDSGMLAVRGANWLTIVVVAETGFAGYDTAPDEEVMTSRNVARLRAASESSYESLKERHVAEHRELFNRVAFKLGASGNELSALSTDERLARYQRGESDLSLEALYYQYGRYLLMASSRPGTQPANLQGIWNPHVQPPWFSDYTVNINTQMNYWPAEIAGLSECHEPLFDMLEQLSVTGARTATIHYGCRGWTTHHNVDLWRSSTPTGGHPMWAFWPLGGAWLVRHLWERYMFTGDMDFLRERAFPIMKGAALFCLDWLVEGPDGVLVTNPSTSPENEFLTEGGEKCSVTMASTMDVAIIRELLRSCLEAISLLGGEDGFRAELTASLARLPDYQIGRYGQIQEWYADYEEAEPGHRHVSHLYGLYPGNQIHEGTPELFAAAAKTLERRLTHGGGHTGWSCAWLINLFARLKDGEQAYGAVRTLLAKSTYPNLFDAHPPFQIDGNFGGTAGMTELLLQSQHGVLELLPTLPGAWSEGAIRGLRARGGYGVDIAWSGGKLSQATIRADRDGTCRVRRGGSALVVTDEAGTVLSTSTSTEELQFPVVAGGVYQVVLV